MSGREQDVDGAVPTRVLIADVDPFVRYALKLALVADGFKVVGEMSAEGDVIQAAADAHAAVVLIEPCVRGEVRLDLVSGLIALDHRPEVVGFSSYRDLAATIAALSAGARGYLRKLDGADAAPEIVRAVARGDIAISGQLTLDIIEYLRAAPLGDEGMRPVRSPLTPREWEVLDLMSRSMTTQAIAETLVVSPDTVYSHVKNVMRKLDVHSRAEAIAVARAGVPNIGAAEDLPSSGVEGRS